MTGSAATFTLYVDWQMDCTAQLRYFVIHHMPLLDRDERYLSDRFRTLSCNSE